MTVETLIPIAHSPSKNYRQTIVANHLSGSFVGDDSDNHDFKVDGRGKGRFSVCVHNKTDKTATITVYGMHDVTADVGDTGVFQIGSFTVLTTVAGYECVNDPFPFYLIRVVLGASPDGETVYVYSDFSAF